MTGKTKILVIDDDESICSLIKLKLEKTGKYVVWATQNGQEGIKSAKKEKPDIIILDLVMRGIQGGEVAHILSEDPSTKDIPIIFLSSLVTTEDTGSEGEVRGNRYMVPKSPKLINGIVKGIEHYLNA